jgi:hypothetical protein
MRERFMILFLGSHRVSQIERIVVAVAEEVVIARVVEDRIFAGEAAEARGIGPGAVLVNAEGRLIATAGEEEGIAPARQEGLFSFTVDRG